MKTKVLDGVTQLVANTGGLTEGSCLKVKDNQLPRQEAHAGVVLTMDICSAKGDLTRSMQVRRHL